MLEEEWELMGHCINYLLLLRWPVTLSGERYCTKFSLNFILPMKLVESEDNSFKITSEELED
jgi:hypothetical protein